MALCRSCRAGITWARTEHGRKMPVDALPAPASVHQGFVLRELDNPDGPLVISATRDAMPGEDLYTSHFATCPNADAHRKPRP